MSFVSWLFKIVVHPPPSHHGQRMDSVKAVSCHHRPGFRWWQSRPGHGVRKTKYLTPKMVRCTRAMTRPSPATSRYMPRTEWNVRRTSRYIPRMEWIASATSRYIPRTEWNTPATSRYMHKLEWIARAQGRYIPRTDHISGRIGRNSAAKRGLIRRQVLVSVWLWRMEHKSQSRPQRRNQRWTW